MTRPLAVAPLLLGMLVGGLSAQEKRASGAVTGTVTDSAGTALAFSTVWLVPGDTARPSRAALTDEGGRFAFKGLRGGEYYLRLDRVGYESEWSERKRLADAQTLHLAVTSSGVRIAPGRPTADPGTCRSGADIAADTALATLWREALKAATARRLFDRSYRYSVQVKEGLKVTEVFYTGKRKARHELTSTPAIARALEARGSWAGYGVGMDTTRLIGAQEMLNLLTDATTRSHCFVPVKGGHGLRGIHLRPLTGATQALVTAANVLLDDRYRLRRIEFEYTLWNVSRARGYVDFGDGGLKGSAVPFVRELVVWVAIANPKPPERIGRAPTSAERWGNEEARASVKYRDFQRDSTSGP